MILTDREIQAALHSKQIEIEPPPLADAFSSTSIDLTLSQHFQRWKENKLPGVEQVVSPGAPGFSYKEVSEAYTQRFQANGEGFVLDPGKFVLGWTAEIVKLPVHSRLAARVEGKSSLARLGLGVHITAPTIHSGFEGQIQPEMFNHSSLRVKLIPGMKVCTLIFEMCLGTPDKGYRGLFAGQKAV